MAIEQSKGPHSDVRAHATKAANPAARSKNAMPDAKPETGFAAVLAAADEAATEPPVADAATTKNAPPADAPRGAKTERNLHAPKQETVTDKEASHSAEKPDDKGVRKSTEQNDQSTTDGVPLLTQSDITGREPILLGAMALPGVTAEGAAASMQTDVPTDAVLSPQAAAGRGGNGFMRTNQLQHALSASSGQGGGRGAFLGSGDRGAAVTDVSANATPGAAVSASLQDLRLGAQDKSLGDASMLDSGTKMMNLVASVVSQSEYGAGARAERRGSDDARSAASPGQEDWHSEPLEFAGQNPTEMRMEEAPVQETVRYWVGADTKQQAELTVADVAGGAVDVTIHMQGKEALVSFRSDEQQARDALQASSSQLKHMLGQEGLTLSGLSVGTSSAGQDGRQEQRSGAGPGKTTKVIAADAEALVGTGRSSALGPEGRAGSLDLFV